jgi:hypothetical protein
MGTAGPKKRGVTTVTPRESVLDRTAIGSNSYLRDFFFPFFLAAFLFFFGMTLTPFHRGGQERMRSSSERSARRRSGMRQNGDAGRDDDAGEATQHRGTTRSTRFIEGGFLHVDPTLSIEPVAFQARPG